MPQKRATSTEVAIEAGVSRTTVSLVLNQVPGSGIPETTKGRVREAAERLNYHPNVMGRRLASGRTKTLAFVIHQSGSRAAADLFMPEVLRGLNSYLYPKGYHILFQPIDPENASTGYAYLIYQGHVDGIILSGPQLEEAEAVTLYEQHLPIVVTGKLPNHDVPFVDADNYEGALSATNHLINLGHYHIGLITNAPLTYLASRQRFWGYQDALLGADLDYEPNLVREGCFTGESGYQAMGDLLSQTERITAVFVASDVVAFGAIQAIKNKGLAIPEDMAVVGYDDVSLTRYVEPFLTTVQLPAYEIGRETAAMCLAQIEESNGNCEGKYLPTKLIIRDSCGANR
jgi:LacI family transcriptional regulator, galactose operon repressor